MTWWSKIQTMILNPCNLQWGLGGFGTAHVLRRFCFRHQGMFCTPAKCKSSPCSQDSFVPASLVFHANLGRKPYIALVLVAPQMFELLAMNFQNTVFFFGSKSHCFQPEHFLRATATAETVIRFQSRFSLRSEDLMAMIRSGKSSTKSLGSTVSSAGTVAMVGWLQLTNWRFLIDPLMILCQVNGCILNWIIFIFWLLIVLWLFPIPACTNVHWYCAYMSILHASILSTLHFYWTLPLTPPGSPIEHFSTFKHWKKVFLRFLKSQEMCSQFGWDTASGISREQFEDLVGDWWVGRVAISSFCRQILNDFQYFSVQIMKLLKILEWKGLCSQEAPFSRCALSSSASTLNVSLILSERRCFLSTLVQEMRRRQLMKNCVRSWWTISDMLAVSHCRERSDGCDQQGLAEDLISLCVSLWMWISHLNPDYKQLEHRFLCGSMGQT